MMMSENGNRRRNFLERILANEVPNHYIDGITRLMMGEFSWQKDRWSAMLLSEEYLPDLEDDKTVSDIIDYEIKPTAGLYKRIHLRGPRVQKVVNKGFNNQDHIEGHDYGGPYAWQPMVFGNKKLRHIVIFRDTKFPSTSALFMINALPQPWKSSNVISIDNPIYDILVLD